MSDAVVGLTFDETMAGAFAMGATDPEQGARQGKAAGTSLTLFNHITIDDVDRFVADPDHAALLQATLDFAPLGKGIPCAPGRFELFRQSDDPTVKLMIYAAGFAVGGASYYLEGRKFIHDGVPLHVLLDETTTLYTKIFAGVDTSGPVVGAGILTIGVRGVLELVASMRPVGAQSPAQGLHALGEFGRFFFGELWESYRSYLFGGGTPKPPPPPGPGFPRALLALPAADLADGATAEVVVIGSGYGGGVAARRLARAGRKVLVLERGKEWRSGEFPTTALEAAPQFQLDTPDRTEGSRTGLYDFRLNREVDVLVGCGLGGTSLINASVSLEADPAVFDDPRWPKAIAADPAAIERGYQAAREMLRPQPYPTTAPPLPKLAALERSAQALGRPCTRAPINVTFADGSNAAGVEQRACVLCGDCVSGCNYAAKTTVDMTYLPDAKAHGAELYTEVTVRWIERVGDKYQVKWRWTEAADDSALRTLTADVVVLAAGALGSTELLLRSAQHGLSLSGAVGTAMSCNADYLAFSYNGDTAVHGVGYGDQGGLAQGPVGPTITGMIGPAPGQALTDQTLIEEGAIPGLLADALPAAFAVAAATEGINTARGIKERLEQAGRAVESLVRGGRGAYVGAVANTQTYLNIGFDAANGTMMLEDDRLRIHWPGAGDQPIYRHMQQAVIGATQPANGIAIKEPTWNHVLHHNLITVHPLGGCPMGDDATRGAVNDRGQVFAGDTGTAVHTGLYVADGSIIPTSVGKNPLLTICALVERAMDLLLAERQA